MKRILTLTALALGLTGGIAAADRNDRVRDHRDGGRVVVRNNNNNRTWNTNRGYDRRDNRRDYRRDRVVVQRTRPAFRDNRFYFSGGTYRTYNRPVINVRYRDYYRRPALVVENYEPVSGYIWIQGNWNWNGYEWVWMPGHYDVDQNYNDYDYDGGFSAGVYYNSGY